MEPWLPVPIRESPSNQQGHSGLWTLIPCSVRTSPVPPGGRWIIRQVFPLQIDGKFRPYDLSEITKGLVYKGVGTVLGQNS